MTIVHRAGCTPGALGFVLHMMATTRLLAASLLLAAALPVAAAESDAISISQNIRSRHMPHGTILDPIFVAPDSDEIAGYTRCGDSAIWTGHYLAAESFRYHVTHSPEAFDNVWAALWGLRKLLDVTGTGVLARCAIPIDSPYAPGITQEEAAHGVYMGSFENQGHFWVGNTSRDQYFGVFFGLAVAYDYVDDPDIRGVAAHIATRLLDFLLEHDWAVVMPDGTISTVFWGRADQQLTLLQIGRHINESRFGRDYNWFSWLRAGGVITPIALETLDPHGSYFKFNLDVINLYSFLRLGGNSFITGIFDRAYDVLRHTLDDHGNAHFNMIDRALRGPDDRRDEETRKLLEEWLQRPRRDFDVDLRSKYRSCEGDDNRACDPVPVTERVNSDFLWQRSPFQLYGGGDGFIESPGIDYILPYWMAREYGVIAAPQE